ncbi:MAG: nucleotide sugar dehydrogenase, partial [Candidatus Moranbacteria bacterium]|nr:nucleotide sugar dehydrogenase [Candidatus Moranbacteria bacterium]
MKKENIAIIGTGYVGLVTGVCFSQAGHNVTCIDKDQAKINKLKKGIVPIYEPGLDEMVKKNFKEKRLFFSTRLEKAVANAKVVFVAVGTPSSRRGDGYADLSYVYEVAKEIAPLINNYKVIVNKSTVPVGTADEVKRIILEKNPKAVFDMASNPEFLKEGAAIEDFMKPDRIVVGASTNKAHKLLKDIYEPIISEAKKELKDKAAFFTTDIKSAELIKYASNSFLAVKISFINEISNLCEQLKANIDDVAKGMGLDKRIAPYFLKPGPGYGGSCFPKDVSALLRIAQENETALRILESVVEVNIAQKARMIKKIKTGAKVNRKAKTFLFLGLTFKPETDDMRDSSAITIIPALIEKGHKVIAHDPKGIKEAKKILPKETIFIDKEEEIYSASKKAQAVVLLTEWDLY